MPALMCNVLFEVSATQFPFITSESGGRGREGGRSVLVGGRRVAKFAPSANAPNASCGIRACVGCMLNRLGIIE